MTALRGEFNRSLQHILRISQLGFDRARPFAAFGKVTVTRGRAIDITGDRGNRPAASSHQTFNKRTAAATSPVQCNLEWVRENSVTVSCVPVGALTLLFTSHVAVFYDPAALKTVGFFG
jgi:hypothetical protein